MPSDLPGDPRRKHIGELAAKLGLDPARSEATVTDFNAAVRPGTFDATRSTIAAPRDIDSAQDALGASNRYAPFLGLSVAARNYLHLSRREGRRECARR